MRGLYRLLLGTKNSDERHRILEHLEKIDVNNKKIVSQINKQIRNNEIFEQNLELINKRTELLQNQFNQFATWTVDQFNIVNLQN